MTEKERREKIYWHLVGIYNLAPSAVLSYFGKAPCECCKSELAGDRYEFTGTVGKKYTNERIEVICCVDCYLYLFS